MRCKRRQFFMLINNLVGGGFESGNGQFFILNKHRGGSSCDGPTWFCAICRRINTHFVTVSLLAHSHKDVKSAGGHNESARQKGTHADAPKEWNHGKNKIDYTFEPRRPFIKHSRRHIGKVEKHATARRFG